MNEADIARFKLDSTGISLFIETHPTSPHLCPIKCLKPCSQTAYFKPFLKISKLSILIQWPLLQKSLEDQEVQEWAGTRCRTRENKNKIKPYKTWKFDEIWWKLNKHPTTKPALTEAMACLSFFFVREISWVKCHCPLGRCFKQIDQRQIASKSMLIVSNCQIWNPSVSSQYT